MWAEVWALNGGACSGSSISGIGDWCGDGTEESGGRGGGRQRNGRGPVQQHGLGLGLGNGLGQGVGQGQRQGQEDPPEQPRPPKVLADVVEALIAAAWLDSGSD